MELAKCGSPEAKPSFPETNQPNGRRKSASSCGHWAALFTAHF